MMKRYIIPLFLTIVTLVFITGCKDQSGNEAQDKGLSRYNANFLDAFDTQTTVVGYGETEEEFLYKVERLKEKLMEYHRLYDIYHTYDGINNMKTINDNAGIVPVKVDAEIIDLLSLSVEMYEATKGKVNVAMGSVLTIWHEYRDEGRNNPEKAALPQMDELESAASYMDIENLVIDKEDSTVFLKDKNASLDVGGIGKGYAVQKVSEYAKEIGLTNALISVGGNVCAIGKKQDGSSWKIGIENPDRESKEAYIRKVDVKDACVVTSGDYQRYYVVDGVKYCHIIDPDTLMPADYYKSVTIIAKDSGIADALSTALYNLSLEEGMDLINNMDDAQAMWVQKDGSVVYSDGFEKYLAE